MDVFGQTFHLVLRSVVVLFPMTVGCLAFRRLALSQSEKAWIYAAMCLLAAVTSAAILPWTLGLATLNWVLLLLALLCPVLWIAVVTLCDVARPPRYGSDPLEAPARGVLRLVSPVGFGAEDAPAGPVPVFRHRTAPPPPPAPAEKPAYSPATRTLLSLARDIRNNPTSERHRPKRLPAPPKPRELPFLERAGGN